MEHVVLVNENDQVLGTMEKLQAHLEGKLHRAFSVFLFNDKKELMLQQRAFSKYHSGGLWSNTCCSHPRRGEDIVDAGKRRLHEELGIEADVKHAFSFIYRAELDHDMIEHELDHVLIGKYDAIEDFNPEEVADVKFMSLLELQKDLKENPDIYTAWFRIIFDRVKTELQASLH